MKFSLPLLFVLATTLLAPVVDAHGPDVPLPHPTLLSINGEFDGDGHGDDVTLVPAGLLLTFSKGKPSVLLRVRGRIRSVVAGDVDLDGDEDLLSVSEGALTLWRNDGSGHFSPMRARVPVPQFAGGGTLGQSAPGAPEGAESQSPSQAFALSRPALGTASDRAGPLPVEAGRHPSTARFHLFSPRAPPTFPC